MQPGNERPEREEGKEDRGKEKGRKVDSPSPSFIMSSQSRNDRPARSLLVRIRRYVPTHPPTVITCPNETCRMLDARGFL